MADELKSVKPFPVPNSLKKDLSIYTTLTPVIFRETVPLKSFLVIKIAWNILIQTENITEVKTFL